MRGYDDASYGDGFADVYDDWYADISDIDATVATLAQLVREVDPGGRGPVLELGVGTGRLAGVEVHGIDSSEAMLQRMAAKPGGGDVHARVADMVEGLPDGPFAVVFVAYNTFFGLLTEERQTACMRAVADRLAPGGHFVIEAFIPDPHHSPSSTVSVRSLAVDRVVLAVSTSDPDSQRAEGQYIDITEAGGVRLRPWSIRWTTVEQLDEMAAAAGLHLAHRWEAFDRSEFDTGSERHVSAYQIHVSSISS